MTRYQWSMHVLLGKREEVSPLLLSWKSDDFKVVSVSSGIHASFMVTVEVMDEAKAHAICKTIMERVGAHSLLLSNPPLPEKPSNAKGA